MNARFVVLGAGPAGATLAAYLARAGEDVLLVDRNAQPEPVVGESLIPLANEILAELGVDMSGFVRKHGAVFTRDGRGLRFPFADQARPAHLSTWHVRRDELEASLRAIAVDAGARFLHAEVHDVALPGTVVTSAGEVTCERFVDAGGRGMWLARRLGVRDPHPELRNAAQYAPFRGARSLPPEEPGDIAICAFDGGWFWFIPLGEGRTSVGLVTTPAFPRGADRWARAVAACPDASARLDGASPERDLRGVSDFTAYARRFSGDGWALVGDAAMFLDPVFSSGLCLALHGARDLASSLITGDLAGYEARIRAAAVPFEQVILSFYDGSFLDLCLSDAPQVHAGRVRQWLISLLAGDVFDPAFRGPRWVAGRIRDLGAYVAEVEA